MPTGRITFPGGIGSPTILVPIIAGNPRGVRDGNNSAYSGGGRGVNPQPNTAPGYGTGLNRFYAGFVPEVLKANYLNPSNQGARAEAQFSAARESACTSNSPSRSQMSEGYTAAIQEFAASNTWQLAGPKDSPGMRAKQPSTKFVSPFSSLPIPTRMPWDL
jgi:hypothetical protein